MVNILICEDEAEILELHALNLRRLINKASFDFATSGSEAAEILYSSRSYDLIISDLNLGDISGIDLFLILQNKKRVTPFILCTSMTVTAMSQNSTRSFYFLSKPYSLNELKYALEYLLPENVF